MIVMAVSGCTGKKPAEQYVSEQLNCSLPAAEKTEVSDTHGGFHGEGLSVEQKRLVACGERASAVACGACRVPCHSHYGCEQQ